MSLFAAAMDTLALIPMGVPDPGNGTAPPGSEKFTDLMGWFKWVALGLCVLALIAAGVMMAWGSRQGQGNEHVGRLGWVLGGVIIVSGAFSLVSFMVG